MCSLPFNGNFTESNRDVKELDHSKSDAQI